MRIFDEVDHLLVETLEGQAIELGWVRDNNLTVGVDDYLRLVLKKTAWYSFIHPMRIGALVANADEQKKLKATLAHLTLPPQGNALPGGLSGPLPGRTYLFPANDQKLEAIALELGGAGEGATLVARINGVEQRIACGGGTWRKGRLAYAAFPEQPVAASCAWTADDTYAVKISFHETPFAITLGLRFSGDELAYDSEYNVAFGPTKQAQLVGHAQ
jgi:hypothetical protein